MADEVRVSHILVEGKGEADELKKKLDNGANFSELAFDNSKCPSHERGGDLGYFGRGKMAKPFENKSFEMDVGEISDPVKTEFGWHIIKKVAER